MWRVFALLLAIAPTASFAQEKPREGTFESHGLTMHYSVLGHGSPVLMLPGGPGMPAAYLLGLARIVAEHHSAILLDQRGTFLSMPSKVNASTVNMALYVDDYEALRHKLGYANWAVLGHSFGSFCAMRYATAHPASVSRLVLAATMPPAATALKAFGANIEKRLSPEDGKRLAALTQQEEHADDATRDRLATEESNVSLHAYFFSREASDKFRAATPPAAIHAATYQVLFGGLTTYDLRPALAHLSMPVLILQGSHDPIDPTLAGMTRDAIPGSHLIILERAGHYAWLEQPTAFAEALLPFLDGVSTSANIPQKH